MNPALLDKATRSVSAKRSVPTTPTRSNKTKQSSGPVLFPVRIELNAPSAKTVQVAGSFNRWNPGATPLSRAEGGWWFYECALPAGLYEYRLVVDGDWIEDPMAHDSVPNPFGGRNSVLKVAASPNAAHLDAAEHLPFECCRR